MFFDGSHRKGRNISLGGARRPATIDTEKLRQERLDREQERRRLPAAIRIQRCYRKRVVLRDTVSCLVQQCDALLQCASDAHDASLIRVARLVLFLAKRFPTLAAPTSPRLHALALRLLRRHSQNGTDSLQHATAWQPLIQTLIDMLMVGDSSELTLNETPLALQLANLYTDPANGWDNIFKVSLMKSLASRGVLVSCARVIVDVEQHSPASRSFARQLLDRFVHSLGGLVDVHSAQHYFSELLFVTPSVAECVGGADRFHSLYPLEVIASHLETLASAPPDIVSSQRSQYLLANCVASVQRACASRPPQDAVLLNSCFCNMAILIESLPISTFVAASAEAGGEGDGVDEDEDDEEDYADDDDGGNFADVDGHAAMMINTLNDPIGNESPFHRQLRGLTYDADTLTPSACRALRRISRAPPHATFALPQCRQAYALLWSESWLHVVVGTGMLRTSVGFVALIASLVNLGGQPRHRLLSVLSFRDGLINELFQARCAAVTATATTADNTHISRAFSTGSAAGATAGDPTSALGHIILACLLHALPVISDDELVSRTFPDSSVLVEVTRWILRSLTSSLAKGALPCDMDLTDALRVLGQLRERDERMHYCPEGFWTEREDTRQFDYSIMQPPSSARLIKDYHRATRSEDDGGVFTPAKVLDYLQADVVLSSNLQRRVFSGLLALLLHVPFVVPFSERVLFQDTLFFYYNNHSRDRRRFVFWENHIELHRTSLYDDAFKNIYSDPKMRVVPGPWRISLVNQHGLHEAGIDGGGLFKETVTELTRAAYDPERGLFCPTRDEMLYPNPHAPELVADARKHFEFLGMLTAKALSCGVLVELPLAPFFLRRLLGRHNSIHDLQSLDAELHRNLLRLRDYNDGELEELGLTMSLITTNALGSAVDTVDLVVDGRNVPVTRVNRSHYINAVAHYHLNVKIASMCDAFLRGMAYAMPVVSLRLFDAEELQVLISGAKTGIDLADLRLNCQMFSAGQDAELQAVIDRFWRALEGFTDEELGKFLKFVTGCSRPPLLGFKSLSPRFAIHLSSKGRLPSSGTCMNLLKLPPYETDEEMREKLLFVINAGAGFELS